MSLHTDQCHILKTFWASGYAHVCHSFVWSEVEILNSWWDLTSLTEAAPITRHFHLLLLLIFANKHCPGTQAQGNERKGCPLQVSTLVQRNCKFCFLYLSVCSPQMSNRSHTSPGSNKSVRGLPHPPRTSWLLCIGHCCVGSLNSTLSILPCHSTGSSLAEQKDLKLWHPI